MGYAPTVVPYLSPALVSAYSHVASPTGSVVCLRFDDSYVQEYSVQLGLLQARGLIAGFAEVSGRIDFSGSYITSSNLKAMADAGMEVMCHTATHGADPTGYSAYVAETLTAATALRSMNVFVNSFVQPGTWVSGLSAGGGAILTQADLDTPLGRLLQSGFAASEGYMLEGYKGRVDSSLSNAAKHFPAGLRYGTNHMTAAPGITSTAGLLAAIDNVVAYGGLLEILCHPNTIGTAGSLTLAQWTSVLDYVQTKRDAGLLDVMTPTAALYAAKGTTFNLLADATLAASATSSYPALWTPTGAPVVAAGGHSGTNMLTVNASNFLMQSVPCENAVRTVRFDVWAKNHTPGSTSNVRLLVRFKDGGGTTTYAQTDTTFATTDAWAKYSIHAGNDPRAQQMQVWIFSTKASGAGLDCDVSDLLVVKT